MPPRARPARAARAGHPRRRARWWAPSAASTTQKGHPTCSRPPPRCWRREPEARVPHRGGRRPHGAARGSRPGPSGSRTASCSPGHRTDVPDLLGRHRRPRHPLALRGHAARPLRGHGRGQGHRVHARSTAAREVLEDERTALLVPPRDARAAGRRPSARCSADADAAPGPRGGGARGVAHATTSRPASPRCRTSTTRSWPRTEAPRAA